MNLPCINVYNKSSFNTLITLKKETDVDSIISINYERMYESNISEEISSHQNSAEVIDHTCDDNGNFLLHIEEEADIILINSINAANDISMKNDDNFIYK